jgi:hypothetical protein
MRREADTGRQRLDEFALAGSRRPVNQDVRRIGNISAQGADHSLGEIAQLAEMRKIVSTQRGRGRLAEQESPDLWRGESFPRKYGANKLSDSYVVVGINLN